MSERTLRIVSTGATAGWVVAVAGAGGLLTIGLFFSIGQPWGTINDLFELVKIGAVGPLMLTFYELGGRTPTRLAQLAQTLGWASVIGWCAIQFALILGLVTFDYYAAATGWLAVGSWLLVYIGLWIAGANLLAGSWLDARRWLGLATGLGIVLFGLAVLAGGIDTGWTYLGGIGYSLTLPIWAFLMARLLRARLSA